MKHALIIEENLVVAKILERRLAALDFRSFDHVWTEEDAVAKARRRAPDLVIVGDNVEQGCGIEAARRICDEQDVPVLRITGDSLRARKTLPAGAALDGPFLLREIDTAVETAATPDHLIACR